MQDTKQNMQMDDTQQAAIDLCLDTTKRIVAVDGPAGTGKTTIMRLVAEQLRARDKRTVLCAPTGKAARRIKEATGFPAVTVHKLLEFPKPDEVNERTGKPLDQTLPQRNKQNPLYYDIVLCDEYSMVPALLNRQLIDALPRGGILRTIGDANQLAPIEPKKSVTYQSMFQSYVAHQPHVTLSTVYRFDGGIAANAARVLKGLVPTDADGVDIHYTNTPLKRVFEQAATVDYSSLENQIITPTNKGAVGTYKLNLALQHYYQEDRPEDETLELPRPFWRRHQPITVQVGDKVVWTENDYSLDILNGETGIITNIDFDTGELTIDFGDRSKLIPTIIHVHRPNYSFFVDPRKNIDLAYALTTHKAQGSQYEHVVYVLANYMSYQVNRHNLYTAMTRAQHGVVLIATANVLVASVKRKFSQIESCEMRRKEGQK